MVGCADLERRAVRVDGRFTFASDRDTAPLVDTIIVTAGGELQIGTLAQPIAAEKTARITFIDRGAIDTGWDPKRMTRGLISHGAVTIAGAPGTPFLPLAQPAVEGATRFALAQRPVNWRKGDHILLPSVRALRAEDEELAFTGVNGTEVTIAPAAHGHSPSRPELATYAANLTRNVVFDSENTRDPERTGHVMLMHSPKVNIANAAFHHLGRTNKLKPIDDPKFENGSLVAGTGTNEGEQHIRYQNLRVEGWNTGIAIPEAGHHIIEGGFYSNARSIVIPTPFQRGRRVDITGDLKFAETECGAQQDIVMEARFAGLLQGTTGYRDPNVLFVPDVTTLNFGKFKGQQLYYPEQGADAVPFPRQQDPATMKRLGRIEGSVPTELLDRTTRDIAQQYGIAIAGAVAPANAISEPRFHGLIGVVVAKYQPEIRPVSNHADHAAGYHFAAISAGPQREKQQFTDPTPHDLRDGWNLVMTKVQGDVRSFLILAGEVKPQAKKGCGTPDAPNGKPNPKNAKPPGK